jgi:DNA-binding NtrC family response regulator
MKDSILNGKSILAVNGDPQVLAVLRKKTLQSCPNCTFHTATAFKEAIERLASFTYHLIMLDIMGDHGFDLLERAVIKKIPVTMLTVHPFNLESLKRSLETKGISFLPKEKLGEVVPLLQSLFAKSHLFHWKRLVGKLKSTIQTMFTPDWETSDRSLR